jgi:hypothetical protein
VHVFRLCATFRSCAVHWHWCRPAPLTLGVRTAWRLHVFVTTRIGSCNRTIRFLLIPLRAQRLPLGGSLSSLSPRRNSSFRSSDPKVKTSHCRYLSLWLFSLPLLYSESISGVAVQPRNEAAKAPFPASGSSATAGLGRFAAILPQPSGPGSSALQLGQVLQGGCRGKQAHGRHPAVLLQRGGSAASAGAHRPVSQGARAPLRPHLYAPAGAAFPRPDASWSS